MTVKDYQSRDATARGRTGEAAVEDLRFKAFGKYITGGF